MIPIIDGHLDLAYNAIRLDRDQTLSVADLRRRDAITGRQGNNGTATVSLADMLRGNVLLCIATLYVRSRCIDDPREAASRLPSDCASPAQAHATGQGQLAYYQMLDQLGQLTLLRSAEALDQHWRQCALPGEADEASPRSVGAVVLMEGADPIVAPQHALHWWEQGVRMVSLVHSGTNAYAVGTGEEGPLTDAGRLLLKEMARLGMILDLSHLSDQSFYEAIDRFEGRVAATHNNCRRFVPGNRHLNDEQIRLIAQRDGVIGAVTFNKFLSPDWKPGTTSRETVTLKHVADHIDHICQITGSARHAAIGSDLDGGFGLENCPGDMDSIADLQKLAPILKSRGYDDRDVAAIFHANWLRFLKDALPEA